MPSAKSPKSKRSPGRARKSTVEKFEKSLEKPSDHILKGFEGVSFLFLLGAIAAIVAWMVYVARFQLDLYNKVDKTRTINDNISGASGGDVTVSLTSFLTTDQYTICYQAVVTSLLLYFAFKYHFAH